MSDEVEVKVAVGAGRSSSGRDVSSGVEDVGIEG